MGWLGPCHALPWGQGSVPPGGAAPAPQTTEMLERTPGMDGVEGGILHASLLSLGCPCVPLPLLGGSWEMASGL